MKRFTIGASDALTLCAIVLLLSCPSVAKGQQEPAAPPRPVCIDAQSPSFQYRDIVNEGSPDRATKRYAVVIGNAMYTNGLGPLPKAAADASEVSRALSSAGFTVYCLLNLDRGSMTNLISVMVDEIPEKSEILFYYAGHGFSRNGENYLLPLINFEIRRDKDLEELGFAESVVLDYLLITKPNYLVLLLDACRGEILIPKDARSTSPGPVRGFVAVEMSGQRTYAAYAAGGGGLAFEGPSHGWFTQAFLTLVNRPGILLSELFEDMKVWVEDKRVGQQPMASDGGAGGSFQVRMILDDMDRLEALLLTARRRNLCFLLDTDEMFEQLDRTGDPRKLRAKLDEEKAMCQIRKSQYDIAFGLGPNNDIGSLFSNPADVWGQIKRSFGAAELRPRGDGVRLRRSPSLEGEIVGLVGPADRMVSQCQIAECGQDWTAVRIGDKAGFVSTKLLAMADVVEEIDIQMPRGESYVEGDQASKFFEFVQRDKEAMFRIVAGAFGNEVTMDRSATLLAAARASLLVGMLQSAGVSEDSIQVWSQPEAMNGERNGDAVVKVQRIAAPEL